jgi:hypothetical protein
LLDINILDVISESITYREFACFSIFDGSDLYIRLINLSLFEEISMNQLRSVAKSVLPSRIHRTLRKAYRDLVFRRAMKQFLKDPSACAQPGNPVVVNLIYGWGNEGYSALDEYLAVCINRALTTVGPTLECGSGLSTILLGSIAKKRGQGYWALENSPQWAKKVQSYLDKYKLDNVVLCSKPLKDYGDFCWYDVPLKSMPDRYFLVVCDGPPGDTKGGRYGLVPIMRERLVPTCVILIDDAEREQVIATARRWEAQLGAPFEIFGSIKPYIEMKVMGTQPN